MADKPKDQYSEEETMRRAKDALRRAFTTPHKPQKPIGKKGKSPAKPVRKRAGRKRPDA